MHEYSIVQSLVDRVEQEACARSARGVHRVWIRIGELSGVDVEQLQTAYDTFRPGTICERASLVIGQVEADWRCPGCGAAIRRGERLLCASCGVPARLEHGDEILLERIELEVG